MISCRSLDLKIRDDDDTWVLASAAGGELPGKAVLQIEALLAAKAQRTPAQRKVSSQLLDPPGSAQQPAAAVSARQLTADVDAGSKSPARASAEARGDATDTPVPQGLVTVDIRADVTRPTKAEINQEFEVDLPDGDPNYVDAAMEELRMAMVQPASFRRIDKPRSRRK